MKTKISRSSQLLPIFVAVIALVPIRSEAQGTVDPGTVEFRALYQQMAIVNVDDSDFPPLIYSERPVRSRTDAAGNVYLVSTVRVPSPQAGADSTAAYRSYVRKFSPAGALLWERTRTVRTENGKAFVSWGDGAEREVSSQGATTNLEAASLALDAADELMVALNTIEFESTSNGLRSYYGRSLLFVKFTPNGNAKSELFAPATTVPGLESSSSLVSLRRLPDDSFVAMIRNQNRAFFGSDSHDAIAVTRINNGASNALFTKVFGGSNPSTGQTDTNALGIDVDSDAAGNIYVAVNQYPQNLSSSNQFNVLCKLDGTGKVLAERFVPSGSNEHDTWEGIDVDPSGNVYVCATSPFSQPGSSEYAYPVALRFSPDLLQQLWRTQSPHRSRYGLDIRLTAAGVTLVHVTGGERAAKNLVSRFSTDGALLWSTDSIMQFADFVVDDAGDVFGVGGHTSGGLAYAKIARNGDFQFLRHLGSNYDFVLGADVSDQPMFFDHNALPAVTTRYISGNDFFLTTLELGSPPNVSVVAPAKLLNISTRMRVETDDNALIGGFIITGDQPKKVLIRGMGPSLTNAGIAGALQNPTLDLDAGTVFNDDWRSHQEQEIIASTIPPGDNREAAIVATLQPGPHTAVLRGKDNTTGVGLVEVYDLEAGAPAQLANISTRGRVQSGENVMIGGFIVDGAKPARVLLRGLGPSIPVQDILFDPTLELVDSNGNRTYNDNWRESADAAEIATILAPEYDSEAAILATLAPGNYTAIVRDKNDIPGIGLIEAYNLQ